MKTLLFTEEHNQFREQVRRFFAKRVTPYAAQWDEKREIPRSIWKEMGDLGFLGFCYDPEYGGAGADEIFRVVMGEELACAGSSGLTIAVAGHNDMATKYIDLMGNDEQKNRWLSPCITGDAVCAIAITEPGAGSDVAALTTKAEKNGDTYIINGQKTFITNGYYGDILVTAAKTDPNADPAYQGVSLFVVEKGTPGVSANKLEKVGCHASDTAEIFFEDVEVPAENLLGGEGQGFVAIMQNFQLERLSVGVLSVAVAQHILDKTLEYARERVVFKKPISKFQTIKHQLVDMALEIEMNRAFVYQCAYHYARGEDVTKEISMLKIGSAEMVNRVAYRATQIYGGYGFMAEYEVARLYADLRPVTIAGGTTEVMKELVARYLGI